MSDDKSVNKYYQLKGVNQKSSKYEMPATECLDLHNLDFDVPGAWQKRPGSTYAVNSAQGTSGPIISLFEFSRLTGESYIIAASNTALFYMNAGGYSSINSLGGVLSPGWTNGQPPDMLAFINRLWACNGQVWQTNFDIPALNQIPPPVLWPAGLPTQRTRLGLSAFTSANNPSFYLVAGATALNSGDYSGPTFLAQGIYVGYSYERIDGYFGPFDTNQVRNIVRNNIGFTSGGEIFSGNTNTILMGFTVPITGVSTIALWTAFDTVSNLSPTANISGGSYNPAFGVSGTLYSIGSVGYAVSPGAGNLAYMSDLMRPSPDLTRFFLFTTIPAASLFVSVVGGNTYWSTTFIPTNGDGYKISAPAGFGLSLMNFDFFTSYVPKYMEINQNFMFLAGFSSAPSVIWFSDVGSPETYEPQNSFEVRTNDGDRIYAMKAWNNQLVVMKEHSFSTIIGSDDTNFQLIELTEEYGCLSDRTVVSYKKNLLWLDRKGILEYNGVTWDIISTPVEGIFKRMNITAAKENACGVHHVYRNQIWFGIPIDGSTTNNITVVYDYLVGDWTFFDGFNPASYTLARGGLARPTVYRGDFSGLVHYMGESFYSDSGQGISCVVSTRFEGSATENQTTLWRRLFLDVNKVSGGITGVINGNLFLDYDPTTIQATFVAYQNQIQTRAEFGAHGKAIAMQLSHFSASLPLVINGYAFANRPLRNV